MIPKIGETWFVDFGMAAKPRWAFVISYQQDGRLALASVVKITTEFSGTLYEVTLPRVQWLREQSYINVQSIQPVKFAELTRKSPGQFDTKVLEDVRAALRRWLRF
jgi:mRNA-degrading endonuclease toxin of MazEF toxin-antitoxin module